MEVETKTASLETLAVTIQALHVNGKQMTLAVFRQLPLTRLVHYSGDADGELRWWGLVRYPIKDEGDEWVVAEMNGRLFRAPIEYVDLPRLTRLVKDFEDKRTKNDLREELEIARRADPVFKEARRLPQLFIAV